VTKPNLSDGTEPLPAQNFHILALSGGGFRGLFTAQILAQLERHAGARCCDMFDFIAGTSIGGIIALGLSSGVSAVEIVEAITKMGPVIFDPRLRIFGWPVPLTSPLRPKFRTKFMADGLVEAVSSILKPNVAGQKLESLATATVVVSFNHSRGRPEIFRSYPGAQRPVSDDTILNAALATSAAPGYFPPRESRTGILIDGGMIANAPDLLALTDAMSDLRAPQRDIRLLSIGTASPNEQNPEVVKGNPGHYGWIVHRRLVQATMAAQERLAVDQARILLHDKYLRIDKTPPPNDSAALDLDRADAQAIKLLNGLAQEAWAEAVQANAVQIGHFCRNRVRSKVAPR
jgi:patatin-like phospholipase/acyl hydrolase